MHYYSRLNLSTKLHQEFLKVDVPTIADDLEIRLDFFRRKLWSKLLADELFERCVIFTSSYFEFVKLKAFFEKINAPVLVCLFRPTSFPSIPGSQKYRAASLDSTIANSASSS